MCATACVYWWCSHSVAIDNHKAYYYMTCRFSITLDSLSLIAVFKNKFSHEMLVGWMQSILSSCYLFVWFAFELWSVLYVVDSRVDCCKQFKFEYLCLFFFSVVHQQWMVQEQKRQTFSNGEPGHWWGHCRDPRGRQRGCGYCCGCRPQSICVSITLSGGFECAILSE